MNSLCSNCHGKRRGNFHKKQHKSMCVPFNEMMLLEEMKQMEEKINTLIENDSSNFEREFALSDDILNKKIQLSIDDLLKIAGPRFTRKFVEFLMNKPVENGRVEIDIFE